MRLVVFIFVFVGSLFSGSAQEALFSPVVLKANNEYHTVEAIANNAENTLCSRLSDVFLYHRNDSTFIAYHHLGSITEFQLSTYNEFSAKDIRSIEYIDNPAQNDLLVIKANVDDTHSASMWNNRFENRLRCLIIDLEKHSLVFDFDIEKRYTEVMYEYAGDINDPSLTKEESDDLFQNREKLVESCLYEYALTIDHTSLEIVLVSPPNDTESDCSEPIPEGRFTLSGGLYLREQR